MSDTEGFRPEGDPAASTPVPPAETPQVPTASAQVPPRPPLPAQPAQPPQQSYAAASSGQQGGGFGAPGQAFGPAAQTGPTAPLPPHSNPAAPAHTAPAPTGRKIGAGKIAGILVAAAVVGGVAGLGGTFAGTQLWTPTGSSTVQGPTTVTVNNTDKVGQTTAVAAKVVPSVVTISVTSGSSGGTGSGVVLSADGYVLTNTHVVTLDGATANPTITVTTSDGHVYSASVVGTDPTYDLAVIKLKDASGLTPIQFGDSSSINVGDSVMAVGAPLGLENTVTTGIVSALNRSIEIASSEAPSQGSESDQNGKSPFQFDFGQGGGQSQSTANTIKIAVIQTDAAINPGNSGGALVDAEGKLVGINVAIASSGGSSSSGQSGNIGVGFSIPSDIADRVAKEIIATGTATHGLLGATVADAAAQSGATIEGALINSVTSGGGAASAGLQAGDVVTEFNGVPIDDAVDLTAQVRAVAGGGTAKITYVRDGSTRSADVTLGTLQSGN